jgi:hypothetical protein
MQNEKPFPKENTYYYSGGDSICLLLKILEKENNEKLFICLRYSQNHKVYNLDTFNEEDFNEFFVENEIIDYKFDNLEYNGLT